MMVDHLELRSYVTELREALDRAGVAPQEREQIVAEVESHVTYTGERPVDAFGPPRVYAAQYAEGPARLDGNASRPGDGIPGWEVVILLLAALFAPYAFVLVLASFVVAAGGAAYVGAEGLVVPILLSLAVAGLTWWAVRSYRRRAGASTLGAWVVAAGVLMLAGLRVVVVSGFAVFQTTASQHCTLLDGVEQCTSSSGSSPMAVSLPELLLVGGLVLLVAVLAAIVLRARRR